MQEQLLEKIKGYQKDYYRAKNIKEKEPNAPRIDVIVETFKGISDGLQMAYTIVYPGVSNSIELQKTLITAESEVLKERENKLKIKKH